MSLVKIKGNDNGTGTVTLEAPNTSTNRSITLPDVNGTAVVNTSTGVDVTGTVTADDVIVSGNTNTVGVKLDNTAASGRAYHWMSHGGGSSLASKFSLYDEDAGIHRWVVDSSGNVGIGTSSPDASLVVDDASASQISLKKAGNLEGWLYAGGTGFYVASEDFTAFSVGGNERARIDSSGNILFGTTGIPNGTSIYGSAFQSISTNRMGLKMATSNSGASSLLYFFNPNGQVGTIYTNGSSTVYSTSSDYRLKENVVPIANAADRVKALNPCRFNFTADPDTTVDGFLAHEAQEVVPEAVKGTKDGMKTEEYEVTPAVLDDDGNVVTEAVMGEREVPDYQGIDQSKLVPLLTAALQEALERIEALEARL